MSKLPPYVTAYSPVQRGGVDALVDIHRVVVADILVSQHLIVTCYRRPPGDILRS